MDELVCEHDRSVSVRSINSRDALSADMHDQWLVTVNEFLHLGIRKQDVINLATDDSI